jgi:hypothetical protein
MLANKENFIVNISRPNCGTCREFDSEYLDILKRNNLLDTVYYLNVAELRKNDAMWSAFKDTYQIQGTPSFIAFHGGELFSSTGWTPDDGLDPAEIEGWLVEQAGLLTSE